jgi:cobalt/nickel transport system permease protein
VGGGHAGRGVGERLYVPGDTPVHRLPAECKLLALAAFALAVVATPRAQFWAFGVHLGLLVAVGALARIPVRVVVRRMVVEVPFVLFALALPFVAVGPRTEVWGLTVSRDGLLGAWNIAAKASLGVVASILLTATTRLPDLVRGFDRLRLPQPVVQIATFMVRYLDVVIAEMERMRVARESRAFRARDLRALPVLASAVAALFVRSYERGERVHLAMLSRGYTGRLPVAGPSAGLDAWARAAALPAVAALVAVVAGTRA